jgi:hypothetical protein
MHGKILYAACTEITSRQRIIICSKHGEDSLTGINSWEKVYILLVFLMYVCVTMHGWENVNSSTVLCSCRNWALAPSSTVQGPYFIWKIPCCYFPQQSRRACGRSGEWAMLIPQESRREPTNDIYIKRRPQTTMSLLFSQLYSHIRKIKMSTILNWKLRYMYN